MTVNQHDILNTADLSTEAGPGRRLREARLAAKLTIEEIAADLNLDISLVKHLEADDYAKLPAPAFVRGYLRNYARLLNLPPAPILAAFDRYGLEPPPLIADIATKTQVRSSDFPVRMFTYMILVGLATLVVVWWQNEKFDELPSGDSEPPQTTHRATSPVEPIQPLGSNQPRSPAAHTSKAIPSTSLSPRDTSDPIEARATENEATKVGTALPSTAVPSLSTAATPRDLESSNIERFVKEGTVTPNSAEAPRATATVTPGDGDTTRRDAMAPTKNTTEGTAGVHADTAQDLITLRFGRDSWAEVYDREGKRLYYTTGKKGTTHQLRGTKPFKVVLGDARDVQIEYNGAVFDYTPFILGGVARFTLGDPESPPSPAEPGEGHQ